MARRVLLGLIALGSACLPARALDYADLEDAPSALLWSPSGRARFVDLTAPPPDLALGDDLRVVTFPWTLAELEVTPGPLILPVTPGRPPPPPRAGYRLDARLAFRPDDAVLDEAAELRIPPRDDADCLRRGGCRDPSGASVCLAPCPAPPAPAPPAPPEIPCPTGWIEDPAPAPAAHRWCRPPLPDADLACGPGEVRWRRAPHCAPVDACPSTPFRDIPGARYVRQGEVGGDGSRALPFGTLQEALRDAPPDATVVLGPGRYAGRSVRGAGVTVIGHCAAQTAVFAEPGSAFGLRLEGDGSGARHLTVQGRLDVAATATVSALRVDGEVIVRARAHLRGSRVRVDPAPQRSVQVFVEARADLEDLSLEGASVTCGPNASLTLADAWVRDATSPALQANGCAEVEVRGLLVDGGASFNSVRVHGGTRRATFEDVAFRDTNAGGVYFERREGEPVGEVSVRRAWAEGAERVALIVGAFDVLLEDIAARNLSDYAVESRSDDEMLQGVLRRIQVRGATGLFLALRETRVPGVRAAWTVQDGLLTDARLGPTPNQWQGALRISGGTQLRGERLWLQGAQDAGVAIFGTPTALFDLHVEGVTKDGVVWFVGGEGQLVRARVVDAPISGVFAGKGFEEPGELLISDFTLTSAERTGKGVALADDAPVRLERFRLEGVTIGIEATDSLTLAEGELVDCGLGLDQRLGVLDLSRLSAGVRLDCERPFD